MHDRLLVRLALLAAIFALAGCGDLHQQIAGKWKTGSGEVVWEFFANGVVTTDGAPGRYSFGDNNRIKIQTGAATFVYQLELQGDRMILKDAKGSAFELNRIK